MIIARLNGGLGNQMFQYALGRHLAYKHQTTVKLDLALFENDKQRNFNLDCFNITGTIAAKQDLNKFPASKQTLISKFINPFTQQFSSYKVVKEQYFHYDTDVLKAPDNVLLDGYWQSEKYFQSISGILQSEFTFKPPLEGRNRQMADLIQSVPAASIHIRRGDYITNSLTNRVHGICSIEYYLEAVRLISSKVPDPEFFIFSDDPEWVQQNIKLDYPIYYVNYNLTDKGFEDMRLMSLCRHHIIANSSFSWWGAWLGVNVNKVVIAPAKWFNDSSLNTRDIYPSAWLRV